MKRNPTPWQSCVRDGFMDVTIYDADGVHVCTVGSPYHEKNVERACCDLLRDDKP